MELRVEVGHLANGGHRADGGGLDALIQLRADIGHLAEGGDRADGGHRVGGGHRAYGGHQVEVELRVDGVDLADGGDQAGGGHQADGGFDALDLGLNGSQPTLGSSSCFDSLTEAEKRFCCFGQNFSLELLVC